MEETKNKRSFQLKGLFSYRWILKNLVFFLFVAFLAILYIANGHEADKMVRDINLTAKNIKELKYEYKTLKSLEIYNTRQQQMAKQVAQQGLAVSAQPPLHIAAGESK